MTAAPVSSQELSTARIVRLCGAAALEGLRAMRERLALAYKGTPLPTPVDRAFARMVVEQRMPRELLEALLEGFAWDAEGRRYESLSLHHVVQGFSTSACEWLMPPGPGARQIRVPVSDALKRRELLEDFLFWYFYTMCYSRCAFI